MGIEIEVVAAGRRSQVAKTCSLRPPLRSYSRGIFSNQSGFGLLMMIAIIACVSLLILGSVQMFENMSRRTQLLIDQTKAHYLAQAGVMRAAWNWYTNNTDNTTTNEIARRWTPRDTSGTPVVGNTFFKAGLNSSGTYLQSNFAYVVPGISFVKTVGTTASNAAGTTSITFTVPANTSVPVGNLVVVYLGMDANGTAPVISSVAPPAATNWLDSKGNTYALQANCANANNANVVRTAFFSSRITTALAAGDTIIVRWTNNVTAKAVSVAEFSGVDTVDGVAATCGSVANGGRTNAPASGNWTATAGINNELLIGSIGVEGSAGDAWTGGTNWLTQPPTRIGIGATTSGAIINPEYRIVSTRAAYSATGTITSRDWAATIRGFYAANRWSSNRLAYWQVYNTHATAGNNITLDKIKVSWTPAGAELINDIRLNNTSVWPGGTAASGTTIDVTDTALAPGAAWSGPNTYIQWNAAVSTPVTVTAQFIFTGDSATTQDRTDEIVLWDGAQASGGGMIDDRFMTITSTGQVNQNTGTYFKVLNTVRANISGAPATATGSANPVIEITDWDEGDKNIP